MMIMFFFFQAEDGIRDGTVTGVQTCALPIYATTTMWGFHQRAPRTAAMNGSAPARPPDLFISRPAGASSPPRRVRRNKHLAAVRLRRRSEERRVGKGGSARWWAEHVKRNAER